MRHRWRTATDTGLLLFVVRTATHASAGPACSRSALRRLASAAVVARASRDAVASARGIRDSRDVVRHRDRDYIRVTNGGDSEGLFTRNIRSVLDSAQPPACYASTASPPTRVTLAGFAPCARSRLACFATGPYEAGIAGALLYFASMVFDCSDGEVARAHAQRLEIRCLARDHHRLPVVFRRARRDRFWRPPHRRFLHHTPSQRSSPLSFSFVDRHCWSGSCVLTLPARIPARFDDALTAELSSGTAYPAFCRVGPSVDQARVLCAPHSLPGRVIGQLPALTEIWAVWIARADHVLAVQIIPCPQLQRPATSVRRTFVARRSS